LRLLAPGFDFNAPGETLLRAEIMPRPNYRDEEGKTCPVRPDYRMPWRRITPTS